MGPAPERRAGPMHELEGRTLGGARSDCIARVSYRLITPNAHLLLKSARGSATLVQMS
jgi:hypothetical protein